MQPRFPITAGKRKGYVRTSILDEYKNGGQMQRISASHSDSSGRSVYKIIRGREEFIFKSVTCLLKDETTRNYLREDFDVHRKSCVKDVDASGRVIYEEGVVKMIIDKENEDVETGEFAIEALYEYFGENLLSLIKKGEEVNNNEARNIMDMMTSVALIMKCLQIRNISHGDLKPENMVTKDGIVKLIDFGLARKFSTASQLNKSRTEKGRTDLYTAPEVIRNSGKTGKRPVKIDVFCWGMSLYQLIANKSFKDLEEDYNLRVQSKDYPKFLEKIENIKIRGNNNNDNLKRKVREVLFYVLNEKHEGRPTFIDLCDLLQDDTKIKELEADRHIAKIAATNEEPIESYTELINRLFNELQEESKERHKKVESAYDNIIEGATSCDLHSICIGDTGAILLAFALNKSKNLKELNLGFNRIQVRGIEALVKGLKKRHTLEILILGKSKQEEKRYYVDPRTGNRIEGPTSFAADHASNDSVENANYYGAVINGAINFGKKGAIDGGTNVAIGGAIFGAVVGGIDSGARGALYGGVVGAVGGAVVGAVAGAVAGAVGGGIAGGIKGAASNKYQAINSNHSRRSARPELRTQIVDNPELDKINNLGNRGTKAIADYLRESKLTTIDLSYCNISPDAIQYLEEAANACTTLTSISVKGNVEGRSLNFKGKEYSTGF